MREQAALLLRSLGVDLSEDDALLLFILSSVEERLKNATNLDAVPEGLHQMAAELAAGEYLRIQKGSGRLNIASIDLSAAAVKQLKEGDTDISFAIGEGSQTPEQRLDNLIAYLTRDRQSEIYRYRRLVW